MSWKNSAKRRIDHHPGGRFSLRRKFADKAYRPPDPLLHGGFLGHPFGADHHPALHRLAGDVHGFYVRFVQKLGFLHGTETDDEKILPDADEHVAVKQEAEAAEHLL